jgi:YHS domain-containing protein
MNNRSGMDGVRAGMIALLFVALTASGVAQGHGGGHGPSGGQGRGQQRDDMQTIHSLFEHHQKIRRTVTRIDGGVETLTESDDPTVQAYIVGHTQAMKERLTKRQPIRMWDPLFAALFEHADKIEMEVLPTPKGVRVKETSRDPYVVQLIQIHAEGVSEFVEVGPSIMHKAHPLPGGKAEPTGEFLGKGDGIETCPVTGAPVDREIKFGFAGRTVYFCCASCRDAFKKSPERYLRP